MQPKKVQTKPIFFPPNSDAFPPYVYLSSHFCRQTPSISLSLSLTQFLAEDLPMAESKEIWKKRKGPSIPTTRSLMGNFTRSKSQTHLHRNQSSQSRPDSIRGSNHQDLQPFVKKPKNSSPAEDSSVSYCLSSVSIKDLRLRRVFSPSSTDGVIPNCLDDTENLRKSEVAGNCLVGNGGFKKLDMLNEDFVQSTPPDAEIFGTKQVVERNGTDFPDQFLEKKPNEKFQKHDACTEKGFHEERNGLNYSIKSVLKPCSRVKLFKTPGSFSYRRLLPYLMDIKNDYSRSPVMGHYQKTEKGLEEKELLASIGQETLADKSMKTGCKLEGHNSDSGKDLNMVSFESLTSQENESSSTPLVNGEIQKLELQVSCEDPNLNCLKHYSSSTIEDSHFNKENLAAVVSSEKMLTDDSEVVKTNVQSPCNANLKVLDQTLSTISNKRECCNYDEVPLNSNDDTKQSEIQGMPKAIICHSFEVQQLNSVGPTLSKMGGNRNCSLQQGVDNDGEVVEQVQDLNGEHMSMTPPDSDMFSKSDTDDSRGNKVDYVSQGIDHIIQKSTDETFCRNNGQGSDKSLDSSPKNKLVPNPRLHLKLSKIPGSFSYRRLLPFLIDITNDYSCASGYDQSPKVENSSKEQLLSPCFNSGKDTCMETFNGKSCPVEHYTGDGVMLPVAAATAIRCSSNHKLTRSPSKQVADFPTVMDSQQEQGSLVKHAALDTNQKLETSPEDVVEPPAKSSSSLTDTVLLPSEGAKSVPYQLPLETEEDCIKSIVKCAKFEKQIKADGFVEASIPPGIPAAGLKKGILKRNPRGCRGICACLNCSSFRLHAERSFEFSRNQMQDAEEVALDLIKELSYLRTMLEKSFGDKDQTSIFINQVKEACNKAYEAEELAKIRLSELNYDLNIHCRIPVSIVCT
ncbi:uncharacterized protein LOC111307275 [Durio zibethinus]|uniref:Uncharacterized protein LOC111307275 n=1 Tax=Durio zibethinus TaxID=66656 RepID=A0A6P6A8A9_DURZI|nr:uncharacterized protein LOC111307275 [Durio zibethinus]